MELWNKAGIERREDELRSLLGSEHALMRMIASSALARRESRGAHWRTDFPERDPALDLHHAVVRGDNPPHFERWD